MVLAAVVVAAAGCSTAGGQPMPTPDASNAAPPAAVAPAAPPVDPVVEQVNFDTWLANFRIEARAAGISAATVDRSLTGLRILPDVLTADGSQPEFVRPVWSYLDSIVNEARVNRGREQLNTQRALLGSIGRDYGVPPETIVAIWAMESNFGSNIGSYNVVEALATLAWHGRRAAFAREQLLAALKIIDQGDAGTRPPDRLLGRSHGPDPVHADHFRRPCGGSNGDGKRDLWTSLPDVFASTADYLRDVGWRAGEPWGAEVVLPAGFDYEQAELTVRKPVAEWRRLGIRQAAGTRPLPDQADASVLLPAGYRGTAFLVLNNFRSILRYNNSSSYGLAVAYLSDRIAGLPGIQGGWPREERSLSRDERVELQRLLAGRGHAAGTPDGIIGANTRGAIRAFQKAQNLPADGFASSTLLDRLRATNSAS